MQSFFVIPCILVWIMVKIFIHILDYYSCWHQQPCLDLQLLNYWQSTFCSQTHGAHCIDKLGPRTQIHWLLFYLHVHTGWIKNGSSHSCYLIIASHKCWISHVVKDLIGESLLLIHSWWCDVCWSGELLHYICSLLSYTVGCCTVNY